MGKKRRNPKKDSAGMVSGQQTVNANRNRRLKRHMKKHPNDAQTEKALGTSKTPKRAPRAKNSTTPKNMVIIDKAGHKADMPLFRPYTRN